MFLSLHVKFIWFQVVPMLYIGSRHLWELLLSILLKLVHFYLKLLKISDCFRKIMRRFFRGSSSQSSKEKAPKPKYNLPRTTEIRACEWPSEDLLRAASIYEDFHELAHNAGLTAFLHDQCDQYLLLTNTFVQNFHFHSRNSPPTVEFHLYD